MAQFGDGVNDQHDGIIKAGFAALVCKQELAALGGGGFQSVLYLKLLCRRRGQLSFLSFRDLFMGAVCVGFGWLNLTCAGIALRFIPAYLAVDGRLARYRLN
jgi:hypothetical protein